MRQLLVFAMVILLVSCSGQWTTHVPEKPKPRDQYLFYLHGGVVQAQGLPAVSSYYGQYEYLDILHTLAKKGFHVISEVRPKDTQEAAYAQKVSNQIDSLIAAGVPTKNISIVGASLGAYMTMDLALLRNQPDLKYALLGLCSEYAVGLYKDKGPFCGEFLSIYEASDSKSSCTAVFENKSCDGDFEELRLNMGNDHAFLFKPFEEWVDPLIEWINKDR